MIGRRLIPDRELAEGIQIAADLRLVGDLDGIDAAAIHEEILVAQHVSGRPELALVAETLPEDARLGIAAAVGEFRELEHDELEALQIVGDGNRRLIALELQAD